MIRNLSKNLINYKGEKFKSEFLPIVERERERESISFN